MEKKAGQGGSLLLNRLEQSMASHQPPQGPPKGPHITNISGDVFLCGEGGEEWGSLLGVNEGGGGSHRGQSISLRTGVDGGEMDSLSAAFHV